MVNIVEHLVQQRLLTRRDGQWTLRAGVEASAAHLPAEVRQLITRRLDALPMAARQALEAASVVVGQGFAVAAVAAGAQCPVDDVEAICDGLAMQSRFIADTGLTVWPDGTRSGSYQFRHALYHEVLYESLGTARRAQLHHQVGVCLEAGYGARAGEIAAQLAVHFERGGVVQRAVHYWQQTGANAARRNAHHDAIAAVTKGLTLLATLPDGPERTHHELTLLLTLGELLMAAKGMGAAEAGEVYTRAHQLCDQLGETPLRFRVLHGLYRFHEAQAQLPAAGALAQQLTHLAHHQCDADLMLEGQSAEGSVALFRGDLVAARTHLESCLALEAPAPPSAPTFRGGHHLRATHLTWMAQVLWGLGYNDQAEQRSQEALALAQQIGHTPSLAHAQFFAAILAQSRRDIAATYARADALIAFATAQGLAHRVEQGRILRGWALAMQGDAAAGVAHIRQGLAARQDVEHKLGRPYYLALLAEASGQAGQPEAGLTTLAEALALAAATEERWWEAEVYRLQGALLLQLPRPDVGQAEACFQQALEVAHHQQAKALELRAALSLARLWQGQGKQAAVRQLLTESSSWFTEGFDTADLQEARVLLEESGF